MKHFYFTEESTGEDFIVGAYDLITARLMAREIAADIAENYGEIPELCYNYEMTDEEAEASGLDEY